MATMSRRDRSEENVLPSEEASGDKEPIGVEIDEIEEIVVSFPGQDDSSPTKDIAGWQDNPLHYNTQQESSRLQDIKGYNEEWLNIQTFHDSSYSQNVDSNLSSVEVNNLQNGNYYDDEIKNNNLAEQEYNKEVYPDSTQSQESNPENYSYDYYNYQENNQGPYNNHYNHSSNNAYESYGSTSLLPQETYSEEYDDSQLGNNGNYNYQHYTSTTDPHYSSSDFSSEIYPPAIDPYYTEVGTYNAYDNYDSSQQYQYQQDDQQSSQQHYYYAPAQPNAAYDYSYLQYHQMDPLQHHPPSLTQPSSYSETYYEDMQNDNQTSSVNHESHYYNNNYYQHNYYPSQNTTEYTDNSSYSNNGNGQQSNNYYENDASPAYATPLTHPNTSQTDPFPPANDFYPRYDASNNAVGIAMSHDSSSIPYSEPSKNDQNFSVTNEVPQQNILAEEEEGGKQDRHLQVWEKFFQNAFAMREAATELDDTRTKNVPYQDTFDRVSRTSSYNGYNENHHNAMIHAATSKQVEFRSEKARHYFHLTTPSPSFPHNNSTGNNNLPNYPWPELISNRKYLSLVSFVENNVNVAVRDISLLYFAIVASILQRDEHNLETLLLLAGAHVRHIRDTFHRHLLHYAAYIGDVSIMALLLDTLVTDMDINEFDDYSLNYNANSKSSKKRPHIEETILHVAVKHNHANIVEFLIQSAIDVHRVDDHGWTAFQWAKYLGYSDCEHLLADAAAATPVVHANSEATAGDMSPIVPAAPIPSQTNASVTFMNPSSNEKVRQSGDRRNSAPIKQLSETQAMPMTRMIDQFLLSGFPEPISPATPAAPSHFSHNDIINNHSNNHNFQDQSHTSYHHNITSRPSDGKNALKSVPVTDNSTSQAKQQLDSNTNSSNNNNNLYKPLSRPKEVDDLIKGFQAKDKARRSASTYNNATNTSSSSTLAPPPSTSQPPDVVRTHSSSPTQVNQSNHSSKKSVRHTRANSTSNKSNHQHLSPAQKHFYDISSDSSDNNHHTNGNSGSSNNSANTRGSRMMESPRLNIGNSTAHNNSPGQYSTHKASSRKSAASNQANNAQNHHKNSDELWSLPKKQLHHSDADDETELYATKRRLASNKAMQEEEQDMIVEEEVIPSLAERLAARLWSLLWFMLQLSVSLLFNRPMSKPGTSKGEKDEEVKGQEDEFATYQHKSRHISASNLFNHEEDDDNNFLYNNSSQKLTKSPAVSASPSYLDKTSQFVRSLFRSPSSPSAAVEDNYLGKNYTADSLSSNNSGKLRLSQPPSNIAADVQQQQRVFLSSAPPPTDLELTRNISSSLYATAPEVPSLPPNGYNYPNQANSFNHSDQHSQYSSAYNNHHNAASPVPIIATNHSSDNHHNNILTPRQPPPEVQVAIAISRQQQQQQQQNSFSLGDRLPQGVAWRYVNILPENSRNDEGNSDDKNGIEQNIVPVVGDEHGTQLRQRKPKVYA